MSDSQGYVINHDFGYGKDSKNINKIMLRNLEDLNVYIEDNLKHTLNAEVNGKVIKFSDESLEVKIEIL